jgi:hypothetical protein
LGILLGEAEELGMLVELKRQGKEKEKERRIK